MMTKYLLADRELNGPDDSDFYAVYFNTETGKIESEIYGSTRFPSPRVAPLDEYPRNIPEEVKQQAIAYFANELFRIFKQSDEREVNTPDNANKGDALELLKGGSFKDKNTGEVIEYCEGETGVVIWIGAFGRFYRNGYNRPSRYNRRVGLKLESGNVVFVPLENCKLARPLLSDEDLRQRANQVANQENFYTLFYYGMPQY